MSIETSLDCKILSQKFHQCLIHPAATPSGAAPLKDQDSSILSASAYLHHNKTQALNEHCLSMLLEKDFTVAGNCLLQSSYKIQAWDQPRFVCQMNTKKIKMTIAKSVSYQVKIPVLSMLSRKGRHKFFTLGKRNFTEPLMIESSFSRDPLHIITGVIKIS